MQVVEERQGIKIGCIEEVAWREGFIDDDQLRALAEPLRKSGYGEYLLDVLAETEEPDWRSASWRSPDAYEVTPAAVRDDRGVFLEWFRDDHFTEPSGTGCGPQQANISVSAARHGARHPLRRRPARPGQVRHLPSPAPLLDVVVDIRVGSPTFGRWDSVLLDTVDRRAVYLSRGPRPRLRARGRLDGHLPVLRGLRPGREHGVHPLDPAIGIDWPAGVEPLLSPKDAAAPTLAEAREQGLLPAYDDCLGPEEGARVPRLTHGRPRPLRVDAARTWRTCGTWPAPGSGARRWRSSRSTRWWRPTACGSGRRPCRCRRGRRTCRPSRRP